VVNVDAMRALFDLWLAGGLAAAQDGCNGHPGRDSGPRTLVLVTHAISSVLPTQDQGGADHFILLRRGRIVGGGTLRPDQLPPGGVKAVRRLIDPRSALPPEWEEPQR
jgi:hypothetical protein